MNIDKNYFLTRLANGEDMAVIANEMTNMMNEAIDEHKAKVEAERKAAEAAAAKIAKREQKIALAHELLDIVADLADLEGLNTDFLNDRSEEDMLDLADAMIATVQTVVALEEILNVKPATKSEKVAKTDEEILHDFLANLF